MTTVLPAVSAAQNGPGTSWQTVSLYDHFGWPSCERPAKHTYKAAGTIVTMAA